MKIDPTEIINQIRSESVLGYSNKISIVDALLEACWCEEEDLVNAYNLLQETDYYIAVIFFQLPFLIRLPQKWLPIRSEYGNPFINFRHVGTIYNTICKDNNYEIGIRKGYSDTEKFKNAILQDDSYGLLTRTQVLLSFQIWGKRQIFYQKYLNSLTVEHRFKSVIVKVEDSWKKDHGAMTSATYEADLAGRLQWQAIIALRDFIPKYSIACRDPSPQRYNIQGLNKLNSYFMMVKSGRIVVRGVGPSMIAEFVKPFEFCDYSQNMSSFRNYLKSNRVPTIYEDYLLDATRQIEAGASNLAIVQTVMILDWFANEIIEDHLLSKIKDTFSKQHNLMRLTINRLWETHEGRKEWGTRIPVIEKFRKYFPVIGINLPSDLLKKLDETIKRRNKIVHRLQSAKVEEKDAHEAIDVGMKVIQFSADTLTKR